MRSTIRALLLGLVMLGASVASAATLLNLLPADTFAAVGVEGLADHEDKAQLFLDEWQRLGLSQLLQDAYATDEVDDVAGEIPESLRNADLLDLIGGELWLTVSASSFNPLPAVTLVAQLNANGQAAVDELLAQAMAEGETTELTEGAITFYVAAPSEGSDDELAVPAEFGALAWARAGDLLTASSNPDVLRGVLRRYQGASEPNLTANTGFNSTVGSLAAGNFYVYLDMATVTTVASPFASGMGFDGIVQRLGNAFTTMGSYGAVSYFVADGIDGRSVRVLGDRTLDPRLYDLLAGSGGVSNDAAAFVPSTALGFQVSTLDIPGWWAWLGEIAASEPQLGVDDLDAMVEGMTGLNLDALLFSWMGSEAAVITVGAPSSTAVGMAMENPLGDSVYLVKANDEAAAEAGIATLFQMAIGMASSFMDPMGEGQAVMPATRSVGGVNVTDWELAEGFTLSTAVAGGYAIIATTPAGMDLALAAQQGSQGLPLSLAPLRERIPEGVNSYALSDDSAALASTADMLLSQMDMVTGLTGEGDIDFEAAEAANQALAQFVEFVAQRLGSSVSFNRFTGSALVGESHMSVDW